MGQLNVVSGADRFHQVKALLARDLSKVVEAKLLAQHESPALDLGEPKRRGEFLSMREDRHSGQSAVDPTNVSRIGDPQVASIHRRHQPSLARSVCGALES